MSEIESLAQDEALDVHIRRHRLDRLIMLCDGVFAIAITLAAVELRFPASETLGGVLYEAQASLLAYLVSFAVIASFWVSNRELFARLHEVDRPLIILTLLLLCVVAVIPAANHALYEGHSQRIGTLRFYALLMVCGGVVNAIAWFYAVLRSGLMKAGETRKVRLLRASTTAMMPCAFLIFLMVPTSRSLQIIAPVVTAGLIFRRLILPRLVKRGT